MAQLPTVAIIGRPNTGKSTLFNRLVGHRKAIVSPTPGTTRDHVAHRIEGELVDYLLLDTGGMGGGTDDAAFEDDVHAQSLLALEHADLIVFTVNSKEELTSSDFEIVELMRKKKRKHVPLILAVTKCDNMAVTDEKLPEYYQLGVGDHIVPLSAIHGNGMDDLEEKIEKQLLELHFKKAEESEQSEIPRIAIVGKPNVGKSSIVNAFMSDAQRAASPILVSEIPGTTRDAIDTLIKYHGKEFVFIDTAGIRRSKQRAEGIENYAHLRSLQAMEDCDVCVLVIDANEPISKQDKRIVGFASDAGKGLIILANKIDTLTQDDRAAALAHIKAAFHFCSFAAILPCSAKTRSNLLELFDLIAVVQENRVRRIPTKALHAWYMDTVRKQPMDQLSRSKHLTQADGLPPTFVVFVKDPKQVRVSELKFLDKRLRSTFAFEGTPVRWITKRTGTGAE